MKSIVQLLSILLIVNSSVLAQMSLDKSFNHNGIIKTVTNCSPSTFIPANFNNVASEIQSNGKIIALGSSLIRYNSNGTVDSSFGINGIIDSLVIFAKDIAIQSDDKILLGGYVLTPGADFAMARYHVDGILDTSFGNGGVVVTPHNPVPNPWISTDYINRVKIQPDGKIVVGGRIAAGCGSYGCSQGSIIERYNANGSKDTTFVIDIVNPSIPMILLMSENRGVKDLEILPNGKIIFAVDFESCLSPGWIICSYTIKPQIFRLQSNGRIDSTFNNSGNKIIQWSSTYTPSSVSAINSLPSGKILMTCEVNNSIGQVRLLDNGMIDSAYGNNGFAINSLDSTHPFPKDMMLFSNGNILISGSNKSGDYFVARFDSSGSLNTQCGRGYVTTNIDTNDVAMKMIEQTDGKIIVAGSSSGNISLVRYNPWGTEYGYVTDSSCYQYNFHGKTISSTGTYYDTLSSSVGCDSVVVLDLTVNNVDRNVTQIGNMLFSSAINARYQWINCNTGNPLIGDTNQTFTAPSNGDYAVIVNQNGCSDTSECFSVIGLGVYSLNSTNLLVYPNPSNGKFTVEMDNSTNGQLTIQNLQGQTLHKQNLNGERQLVIDLAEGQGVFFLQIENQSERITRKIIIQ